MYLGIGVVCVHACARACDIRGNHALLGLTEKLAYVQRRVKGGAVDGGKCWLKGEGGEVDGR